MNNSTSQTFRKPRERLRFGELRSQNWIQSKRSKYVWQNFDEISFSNVGKVQRENQFVIYTFWFQWISHSTIFTLANSRAPHINFDCIVANIFSHLLLFMCSNLNRSDCAVRSYRCRRRRRFCFYLFFL